MKQTKETPAERRAKLMAQADAYEAEQTAIVSRYRTLMQSVTDRERHANDCRSQIEAFKSLLANAQTDIEAAFFNGSLGMHLSGYAGQINAAKVMLPYFETMLPKLEAAHTEAQKALADFGKLHPDLRPTKEITPAERSANMNRVLGTGVGH